MIHFESVAGQNVGTHVEFDFRLDHPGLTLILGKEGSGKSTIFNALCIALYGETPRDGRQRTAIWHPVRKNSMVEVRFKAHGHHYVVTRAWKHKERGTGVWVVKDGKNETPYSQEDAVKAVVEILGISYDEFVTSVYLPQGASTVLLDRSPGASARRWEFLASLSGCGQLDAVIAAAKDEATPLRGLLKAASEVQIALDATSDPSLHRRAVYAAKFMQLTTGRLRKLTAASKRWSEYEAHAVAVSAAKARVSDLKTQLESLSATDTEPVDLDSIRSQRKKAVRLLDELDVKLSACKTLKKMDRPKLSIDRIESKLDALDREDRSVDKQIGIIESLSAARETLSGKTTCPTCGHAIDTRRTKSDLLLMSGQLKALQQQKSAVAEMQGRLEAQRTQTLKYESLLKLSGGLDVQAVREQIDITERLLKKLDARVHAAVEAETKLALRRKIETSYRQAKQALSDLKSQHVERPSIGKEACSAGIDECHERLLFQSTVVERYKAQKAQADKLLASLDELKLETDRCRLMEAVVTAAEFVRKQSVEAALDELIVQAGSRLPITDRLVAKVGAKRFDLAIVRTSDKKTYEVPSHRLSGGEHGKLNAALTLAVKAVSPAGRLTNLLVLDEPAAHVSEAGWLDFLDSLATDRVSNQSVIVSTHVSAAQDSAVWDRIVEVRKSGDTSKIVHRR